MAKSMFRYWRSLVLSGFLIGAAGTAVAAEPIVVSFSGSSTTGSTISGAFDYLQSHKPTSLNSGTFNFFGSTDPHGIAYIITDPSTSLAAQGSQCSVFIIQTLTAPDTFQLSVTYDATTILIDLPTSTALSGENLPDCSVFTSTAGSLKQTVNGVVTKFSITVTSCGVETLRRAPQTPQAHSYVYYVYSAPVTCPVYACQPRPTCSLPRLFCGRSLRMSCR